MPPQHKLLLLDDDPDLLELYRDILGSLPSKPEIVTATSGARAIALLDSEPFTLLISDLNMPKMDGLQVLTIVRRKFPQLRTAVLTSVADEQFRTRAYAMGIDLFLEKPNGTQEIRFMLDCIESLLGRDEIAGFRGVQHKSLVDIVQLECLSQSSSTLRIINGLSEGRIWIQGGEIIDAATQDLKGEQAFKRILSWKTGNFELLAEEVSHPRVIFTSYQGLLLETAQALDESEDSQRRNESDFLDVDSNSVARAWTQFHGVEFVLMLDDESQEPAMSWGTESPDQLHEWARQTTQRFQMLGETLQAGNFGRLEGAGPARHVSLVTRVALIVPYLRNAFAKR